MLAFAELSGGMGGFGVGLQGEGGELYLAVNAQSSFSLQSAVPHNKKNRQSSQPLFLSAPGSVVISRVAVMTWPLDLLLKEPRNPPLIHFCLTAVWSCVMQQSRVYFWVAERLVR